MPREKSSSMDITRIWNPKGGSQGYFAHDRYRLLPLVCLATGTKSRIEKIGDETRIQLQGSAEWEVNETMQKLDGLASVMVSLTLRPYIIMHMANQTELNRCALSCNYGTRISDRITGLLRRALRSC